MELVEDLDGNHHSLKIIHTGAQFRLIMNSSRIAENRTSSRAGAISTFAAPLRLLLSFLSDFDFVIGEENRAARAVVITLKKALGERGLVTHSRRFL